MAMSTIAEITLFSDNKKAIKESFEEIKRIENKFSRFNKESEISKINLNGSAVVSGECIDLLKESIRYKEITNGAFDITKNNGNIFFSGNDVKLGKDTQIDLGGIAKGYAVDKIAGILRKNNIKRSMINIGGNLYLIGLPQSKNHWVVGIKDPSSPSKLKGRIKLNKEAGVSTSGDYERPGHIINPKTGESVKDVLSVTIIAKTATEADALSTGVFVLGGGKGMELIEKLPDVEGIIIDKDGVYVSSGLKDKYEPR
jgi:thiamine biosynthesis lipoprotein